MSEFNPYRAPETLLPKGERQPGENPSGEGMWSEGKLLVMRKEAEFPDRCVKCNAPAEGYRLKRKLSWSSAWYGLILLSIFIIWVFALILYLLVHLIARKQATVWVPICPRHRRSRKLFTLIGWMSGLASIGMTFASVLMTETLRADQQMALLGLAVVFGLICNRSIAPEKITDSMIWIKGVSPAFLASLSYATSPSGSPWINSENAYDPDPARLEVVEDFGEV